MSTEQLKSILSRMDIPVQRKSTLNKNNLKWLYKNLCIKNEDCKGYDRAIAEIENRLTYKIYDN